jgi:methyl-accepting chemotaxis protein-1 (serine sensor receptor)
MKGSAEHASEARSLADELATTAASASQAIGRTAGAMQVIDSGSRKIADITAIIEGIAFQTNILALNAAVEAARAGPQGRGFAVVAGEVRSLAQHATDAAKEIGVLIADSVAATADGAALVAEVEHAVSETLAASERLAAMMNAVAAGVGEQRVGIEQIDAALQVMDSITQQNAALVEQASAAAQALDTQSKHLTEQVAFFRLA